MSTAFRDRQGDTWTLGPDGLMHTPETAPFSREHVERKWGPLVEVTEPVCTCFWVENPWSYYGAVEPGGAVEPNPDCPVHFPVGDVA